MCVQNVGGRMNKTAKEMFDELGFIYYDVVKYNKIVFKNYWVAEIQFDLKRKEYYMLERGPVDNKLHQAITKQMLELGWL